MSIADHSKPSEEYVIFSVYQNLLSKQENKANHKLAIEDLEEYNINYKEMLSCYDGQGERSLIVNRKHIDQVIKLSMMYHQDSILLIDRMEAHGLRKARLYFLQTNRVESIGYLKSVGKKKALRQNAFTYDFQYNKYYITTPTRDIFLSE